MNGERLNIWGKPGCELPSGQLCVACCKSFTITEFNSPAGELCLFAAPGRGCKIVFDAKEHTTLIKMRETRCSPYHCSQSDPITQTRLKLTAYHMGQVNSEDI